MKALIVAGGAIDDTFISHYIGKENYDLLFAVDRGLHYFDRQNVPPNYIVGDFDSVGDAVLAKFEREKQAGLIRLNPHKDDTDTEHALHMALELGCDTIHLMGGTGSRLDHLLGNLQLLGYALRKGVDARILDPCNQIRLIKGKTVIKRKGQFGRYVSLIPYTPRVTGLTLTGFLYPLTDHTMSSFYLEDAAPVSGISNEIIEDEAQISMREGVLVLVESRDAGIMNDG